jgi:hypothetical protein
MKGAEVAIKRGGGPAGTLFAISQNCRNVSGWQESTGTEEPFRQEGGAWASGLAAGEKGDGPVPGRFPMPEYDGRPGREASAGYVPVPGFFPFEKRHIIVLTEEFINKYV